MINIQSLYEQHLTPSSALIEDITKIEGDIMLLGVGGKMGPSLAKLALDAIKIAGIKKRYMVFPDFRNKGYKKS